MRHRLEKTLDLGAFGELFFVLFEHLWWLLLLLGAGMCLGGPWGVPGGVSEELLGSPLAPKAAQSDIKMGPEQMFVPFVFTFAAQLVATESR